MAQRRGVHLIEVLVILVLLAAITGPLVGWTLTIRRSTVKSEKHALARALLAYLAQDCLHRRAVGLMPQALAPATTIPCLAGWARQVAPSEELERAWAGMMIGRDVVEDGALRRVRLMASWPEGRHVGSLELTLEVEE